MPTFVHHPHFVATLESIGFLTFPFGLDLFGTISQLYPITPKTLIVLPKRHLLRLKQQFP
jgi:hypothetical protein